MISGGNFTCAERKYECRINLDATKLALLDFRGSLLAIASASTQHSIVSTTQSQAGRRVLVVAERTTTLAS